MTKDKKFPISETNGIRLYALGVFLIFVGSFAALIGQLYFTKLLFLLPIMGIAIYLTGFWIISRNA